MNRNFPKPLLDHFSSESQTVHPSQLFAIALGKKVENDVRVQELIYPPQEGIFENVVAKGKILHSATDRKSHKYFLGFDGQDTLSWIEGKSETFKEANRSIVAAWILSQQLHDEQSLSKLYLHTQYELEQKFPYILAGVFGLGKDEQPH